MEDKEKTQIEYAAMWLRSEYFGTANPEIPWKDAAESERVAWLRLVLVSTAVSGYSQDYGDRLANKEKK